MRILPNERIINNKNSNVLKNQLIVMMVFIALICYIFTLSSAFAFEDDNANLVEELSGDVKSLLNDLDLSQLDMLFATLDENIKSAVFGDGTTSVASIVQSITDGRVNVTPDVVINAIISIVVGNVGEILAVIGVIFAIGVLCGIFSKLKLSHGVGKSFVETVCYVAVVGIIVSIIVSTIRLAEDFSSTLESFSSVFFPITLTLTAATGQVSSQTLIQPMTALLSFGMSTVFSRIILPVFCGICALSVVMDMSEGTKLNELISFAKSTTLWIIGICFTVFSGFLTVKGLMSSSFDSVSIKAAKYTVSSMVPIIGGYIKDGFDVILTSVVLLKNAFGVFGIIMILLIIASPILKMAVIALSLKFASGLLQPFGCSKISALLSDSGKNITLICISALVIALMFVLTVVIIVLSSNAVITVG